jgi:ABC-type phosphate transport system substrate-binding protein
MMAMIRMLLAWIPGEIERNVNLVKLEQVIAESQINVPAGQNRFVAAALAIVSHAPEIFLATLYREQAKELFSHVLNTHSELAIESADSIGCR